MGIQTLSEMRIELLYQLDNRNDIVDDRLDLWLNQAYIHVCRPFVHRHREMQFTHNIGLDAGVNTYLLSDTVHRLAGVSNVTYFYDALGFATEATTRSKVKPRSLEYMDNITKASGIPTRYAKYGSQIILNTLPSSAEQDHLLQVRYWGQPLRLLLDAATTVIQDYFDEVIIAGALFRAQKALGGFGELAVANGQIYQAMINDIADDFELNEDEDFVMEVRNEPYMARSASS